MTRLSAAMPRARAPAAISMRRARFSDAPGIARLIAANQSEGFLLPRTEAEIRDRIDRFVVVTRAAANSGLGAGLIGAAALEPYGDHLAEIRSLVVDPRFRGAGLGARIIQSLLRRARRRGVRRVFALTVIPAFFGRCGFTPAPLDAFPEKVFRDCARCLRRHACIETAVEWRAAD